MTCSSTKDGSLRQRRTVPCANARCGERRVHYERPDTLRGPQTVEVRDDYTGPAFCSIECAAQARVICLQES